MNNYDWSGLAFPVSIKDIGKFETRNNISVNVLGVEGRDIYIHRKGQRMMGCGNTPGGTMLYRNTTEVTTTHCTSNSCLNIHTLKQS